MRQAMVICAGAVLVLSGMATAAGSTGLPAGEGSVNAVGEAALKRQPDVLRIGMVLQGEGADLKEALAKLNQERESTRSKLAELGAVAESIDIGDPALGGGGGDARQQQMQMMRAMQRGRQPEQPKSVATVSSQVLAEWSLPPGEGEAWLVSVHELQEKIRAAFAKDGKALSPEEQEIMEEMMMFGRGGSATGAAGGAVSFLFVKKISEQEKAGALREAFEKAREEASRLAAAAGVRLGGVRQLNGGSLAGPSGMRQYMNYGYWDEDMPTPLEPQTLEASAAQPGPVTYQVRLMASFMLERE